MLTILTMFKSLLISILLFLPYFVAHEESAVYEYGPDNFKQQITDLDGNFIMFSAPWCRHCKEFQPIWSELAELVNTQDSKFAIAQVDCTKHSKLCHENDITGYPSLLYFHKNSFSPVEYKGTRDLPSLTLFLSETFTLKAEEKEKPGDVKTYSGMVHLNDQNVEKFLSKGQHFVMFYAPWCRASQRLAPIWAELAAEYAHNEYIQIGKLNCVDNVSTCKSFDIKQYPYLVWIVSGRIMGVTDAIALDELQIYVEKMLLTENHDPEKFMKKTKVLPVARISEETYDTFMEKEFVYVNYFATWCAHCMQLKPLWMKLGEKFQNESRILIADIDCVRSKAICETEKISDLPTLILYRNKKIVSVTSGARSLESLITTVHEHLQVAQLDETSEAESMNAKDEL
ncbi:thioredoxin domain-containing protein 5 homolog [Pararge aegeria]|nr:thioredoxin domain-containing protein 5 homolog [Pararge aegeria]